MNAEQSCPDDLGHVGTLVQAKSENRGQKGGDDGICVDREKFGAERNSHFDAGINRCNESPEQQLNEYGHAAEEPDHEGSYRSDDVVRRQPGERQQDADNNADRHGDHGQDQRIDES
ncbi:hypothetical protein D3C74_399590 [compost metagenome]